MKKSEKQLPEHYDSIDAPVYIWQKIHESNDLSWLLLKRKKLNEAMRVSLQMVWENIYDQYLKEFGFSDNFLSIKQKEIEIALLQMELILTGDRIVMTWIEIAQEELKDMVKNIGKSNFMESKIAIESKFKFQVNMMSTSIREFYSYIKHLK